jgi:hypothetical protein
MYLLGYWSQPHQTSIERDPSRDNHFSDIRLEIHKFDFDSSQLCAPKTCTLPIVFTNVALKQPALYSVH